jgi:hypothetical protein
MNIFGRMSFQVPGGMLITGALMQFYRLVLLSVTFSIADAAHTLPASMISQ